jgi:hypothetical protein
VISHKFLLNHDLALEGSGAERVGGLRLTGRRAFLWHGDIAARFSSTRKRPGRVEIQG